MQHRYFVFWPYSKMLLSCPNRQYAENTVADTKNQCVLIASMHEQGHYFVAGYKDIGPMQLYLEDLTNEDTLNYLASLFKQNKQQTIGVTK